jgi:hypothetical protein
MPRPLSHSEIPSHACHEPAGSSQRRRSIRRTLDVSTNYHPPWLERLVWNWGIWKEEKNHPIITTQDCLYEPLHDRTEVACIHQHNSKSDSSIRAWKAAKPWFHSQRSKAAGPSSNPDCITTSSSEFSNHSKLCFFRCYASGIGSKKSPRQTETAPKLSAGKIIILMQTAWKSFVLIFFSSGHKSSQDMRVRDIWMPSFWQRSDRSDFAIHQISPTRTS